MDAVQDDNKTVIIIEEYERERFRNALRKVLEREKSDVKFDAVEAATGRWRAPNSFKPGRQPG